ncbi:putative porin [Lutibacter sp.]|uniref:putative porin n=1 Tax=Lutibacter sp. TaxID=1925666 RepID=UPI0025C6A5A5|nr:putative porin [Lutibacter sp.]MCF6182791.1 putative porin [Lutibacter sp.]
MKKIILVFFFGIFAFTTLQAQFVKRTRNNGLFSKDSTSFNKEVKIKLSGKTNYKDYKIIDINNDTTIVDTTLTIKKDYKFNFIRKDDFELLPFHNQGETYTTLAYSFENENIIPTIGFSAKQFNYYTLNDINYYYVPTPTSELMYRTGMQQGQLLDAFLTLNTSKQFNISIAYKGLRSLGRYRNTLASHGNFRTSFNYHTKNKRYFLKGHFYSYDFSNQENGGLTDQSVLFFESNDTNYIKRERLDVNYANATSLFEGKRYYFDQSYTLFTNKKEVVKKVKRNSKPALNKEALIATNLKRKERLMAKLDSIKIKKMDSLPKISTQNQNKNSITIKVNKKIDSLPKEFAKIITKDTLAVKAKLETSLKIGSSFLYETKHYRFNQTDSTLVFGSAFASPIVDHTSYQKSISELYALFTTPYLGTLKTGISNFNYNYHYNSILYLNNTTIPDHLKGNAIAVNADWNTHFGEIFLKAKGSTFITGTITGSSLYASASFKKDSILNIEAFAKFTSKAPDFNKQLYQSDYINYNWRTNFNNEKYTSIGFQINSPKWGTAKASYNSVNNYTYFDENSKPTQTSNTLNYFRVKAEKSLHYKKFTLANTVLYQKVLDGFNFFRVPEIITRNSLYFSSYVFKGKPMYLQTGVTFKYFSAFKANAFNPLLNEFVLQNNSEIGNYPILDFFVNAQIKRTRLFLKVENFSAGFSGRNYFAAPNYPYRDLTVRFGLVWNFFI